MRVKYKPKPKIPVGSVPRERETTPSAETGKETTPTPVTGEATANVSPSTTDSVSTLKEVRTPLLNVTSQESPNVPVSTVNCTTSSASGDTPRTLTCSPRTTGLASNPYLTSGTSLTGFGTNSTPRDYAESNLEPSHLATNNIRTSSTDGNSATTSSIINPDSDRQNGDYSSFVANDQFNSSSSFEEGLPSAMQVESVTICDDNSGLHAEDVTMESNVILQPSSHRYPSFIESLSSSILSQVASSHRALGLEQPADDELVSTSAVETTYRRRCYDEESCDGNDEEMDVFDSCVDDRVAAGTSNNHPQPHVQTEVAAEVEVGSDNDNDNDDDYAVARDDEEGEDDDTTEQTASNRKRKQPEPKKKRKGSQSSDQPAAKKQRKLSTGDSQQKNKSSNQLVQKKKTAEALNRKKKEAPDVTKMTMSELTTYNPKANPMRSTVEARKRRRELKKGKNGVNRADDNTSNTSSQSSNATVAEQEPPDVELVREENDLASRLVPQLTVGEDGQIILNEKSLTVDATLVERELDSDVIYESSSSYTTSHRYSKKSFYIKNWDEKETQKFYEILSKTGTDFTMMALWFPKRTRMEIKRKFKREEKRNPSKISQALKKIVPLSVNNNPPQGDT